MAVTRTRDAVAEPVADSSRRGWTVRTRVLATVLAFMVGGVAIIGVLTYAAQFRVLDENVEADLHQEYRELDLVAHEKQATAASCTPRWTPC